MTRFAVHDVGAETLEFLAGELSQGHTLLRELGHLVGLVPGHCSIYAPVGISVERLRRDRHSPLAFEPPPLGPTLTGNADSAAVAENTQELVTQLALERLSAAHESLLVIEDAMARRGFPAEHRKLHDKLYCEDRVYRIVAGSGSTRREDVLGIVRASASSFGWAIACCMASRSDLPESGGEISSEAVRALGTRATWFSLELFDGDGLLSWTRVSRAAAGP